MLNESYQYFDKIFKELVTENVNQDKVINAIQRRREVKIIYDSKDNNPNGKKLRIIQPVAYGLSKSGNEIVRAFQPMGDTETDHIAWKTFRLDRIEQWSPTRKVFTEPPGFQYQTKGLFNPNGDNSMSEVYKIADFKGASARYQNSPLKKYNEKRHKNTPVGQEVLNKIKGNKSYNAKDFDYIQKNINQWKKPQNWDSVYDMAQAEAFGNGNVQQTSEPISKNNQTVNTNNRGNNLNYNNVIQNGPITKKEENKEENENG